MLPFEISRAHRQEQVDQKLNWEIAMQVPLEITFRGMDRSEAVEAEIRKHVDSLEHFCDRIISCHVTI
jgi:hypothetical protein